MGDLKNQVRSDLSTAMKARETLKTSVLRMVMSAFQTAEVAGDAARELTDAEEKAVLAREVSSRKDSAAAYTAGNRPELADKELAEIEILQVYLPAPLTDAALQSMVEDEFQRVCATGEPLGPQHMGLLIKAVQARADGRADGGTIAALVKAKLAKEK